MQEDELVLSDVHLGSRPSDDPSISYECSTGELQIAVATSRFQFQWPLSTHHVLSADDQPSGAAAEPDEDGDMVVRRRSDRATLTLAIEHGLASPLPLVGLQVWAGALLLCDYLLHNHRQVSDKVVLELGAGTGICSIVAAMFARKVICTDHDDRVLSQCRRNVSRNDQLIRRCSSLYRSEPACASVEVRELNWELADPLVQDSSCRRVKEHDERRCWAEEDIEVILAADVIYDNQLTDHLFGLLQRLVGEPPKKTVLISLERRLNFTLENLDVSCPAHDHFLRRLDGPHFGPARARQIPTDFPQYFDYERNRHLELWEISG